MVVIILTTTVNVQNKCYLFQTDREERIAIYNRSLQKWLNTSFKIILVENSGYPFDEFKKYESDTFEIIHFNENTLPEASFLINNNSKGASELFSINYALKNSKIYNGEFVIKVTGRYFIPNFKEYLESKTINTFDGVIQNDKMSCEIIGCHSKFINKLFHKDFILNGTPCNHIEFLYKHRISQMNKVLILKKMSIEPTQMGGADVIKYEL
jgi:hypothetical protein